MSLHKVTSSFFSFQDPEKGFVVKAGTLGFSVTVYTIFAILGLGLLLARRFLGIFGNAELGGNNGRQFKLQTCRKFGQIALAVAKFNTWLFAPPTLVPWYI